MEVTRGEVGAPLEVAEGEVVVAPLEVAAGVVVLVSKEYWKRASSLVLTYGIPGGVVFIVVDGGGMTGSMGAITGVVSLFNNFAICINAVRAVGISSAGIVGVLLSNK